MPTYTATVIYRVFILPDEEPPKPMATEIDAKDDHAALAQLWERFNHAIPGVTGDLAEKFEVRSMCIGDEILLQEAGREMIRRYVVAPVGFDLIGAGENKYAVPGGLWNPAGWRDPSTLADPA
jgi:hypothetical protein